MCVSYDVVMNVCAGVHGAAVQGAVVSGRCLPVPVVVIGHDIDEVKVTVDLKIRSRRSFTVGEGHSIKSMKSILFNNTEKTEILTLNKYMMSSNFT